MPTIRDVAKKAGLSIATVSATLNSSAAVSAESRRRVWAAVEAVGYTPNAIARSLRLGRSRLIGLVLGDIANPFCSSIVRTVDRQAVAAGYSSIVCDTDQDEAREAAILDQLVAQHVAGIVLTPIAHDADCIKRLTRPGLPPIVIVDQDVPGLERDFVGVDNRKAARILTEYLLRLGHRRIAMITGLAGQWTSEERFAAFVECMREAVEDFDASLCVAGDYRGDKAYEAAVSLMTRPDRPSAIIGANNVMALGALQAVLDLGFRCPGDVSIAGIDDVPWGGLVRPRVTSVVQPVEDIAGVAIQWLLERIAAGDPVEAPAPRRRIFQPSLIVGGSCAEHDDSSTREMRERMHGALQGPS